MTRPGGIDATALSFVHSLAPGGECDAVRCQSPLFAVADGVDHLPGSGEQVLSHVERLLRRTVGRRQVRAALHAASWASWSDGLGAGSTATVTIAHLRANRVMVGHVGDSRAYLLRDHTAHRLTDDHASSGASDSRDDGVTRLGQRQSSPTIDVMTARIAHADKIVLCSDGLWRQFEEGWLASLCSLELPDAHARLFEVARSATEDASAVIVQFRLA